MSKLSRERVTADKAFMVCAFFPRSRSSRTFLAFCIAAKQPRIQFESWCRVDTGRKIVCWFFPAKKGPRRLGGAILTWRFQRRDTEWCRRTLRAATAAASGTSTSKSTGEPSKPPGPQQKGRAIEKSCSPRGERCSLGTSMIKVSCVWATAAVVFG